MDTNGLRLFRMAHQKMGWLTQRQTLLAQNVANADSPNYQAQDLKPLQFKEKVKATPKVNVAQTTSGHITGTLVRRPFAANEVNKKDLYEIAPDGNTVNLEEQLHKVAESNMQYQLTANLYEKHMKMFKMAIGKNDG